MGRLRRGGGKTRRIRIGASDGSLTGAAGMVAISELVDRLDVTGCVDRGVGSVKQRRRGLSGGQLMVALAGAQLLGEDCLAGLDRLRGDEAGRLLGPAPVPRRPPPGR